MSETEQQNLPSDRIVSIDALRGFDMFWIIGGGTILESLVHVWKNPVTETIHTQLEHVDWQGFHFEDLIFPLFLFIMGAVLPFSISRRRQRGQSLPALYLHILKRSAVLILLGLIFNDLMSFNWSQMRWMGVLQRIGLCYFFAAIIVLHTKWRTQTIFIAAVLILYWLASALIPVPGFGAGVMTKESCLSSYIDQQLIPGVLYYGSGDNEGLLSTLPAICTALMGSLAGLWLRSNRSGSQKVTGLAVAGLASVIVGYLWGFIFPIIKIIWTSSYTLFSGGFCLMLLALFYWVIDVKGYRKWTIFFVVIGVNPITIYFLQRFVDFGGITEFFLSGLVANAGQLAPLILPIGVLTIKWLLLWFLYRHKIFFKV
jgi:predicted acyltransferase